MQTAFRLGTGLMVLLGSIATDAHGQETNDPGLQQKAVTDPAKPDTFVGTYRIKGGENSGEVIPVDRVADHLVRFTEDTIVVMDGQRNQLYACTYRIVEGHEPARLDLETVGGPPEARGQQARGIIRRDVDEGTVLLCYRVVGEEYPEEFRTEAGTESNLFVLEPIEDESTAPR